MPTKILTHVIKATNIDGTQISYLSFDEYNCVHRLDSRFRKACQFDNLDTAQVILKQEKSKGRFSDLLLSIVGLGEVSTILDTKG